MFQGGPQEELPKKELSFFIHFIQACGVSEEVLGGVYGRNHGKQRAICPALCVPPAPADTVGEVAPEGFNVLQLILFDNFVLNLPTSSNLAYIQVL